MRNVVVFMGIFLTFLSACSSGHKHEEGNVWYTCSMDPQVMEKKPGLCPVCKMELTKIVVDLEKQDHSLSLSKSQIQLANIRIDTVRTSQVSDKILWRGVITENKNRTEVISSRVPGRVDRLEFKETGRKVEKGDVLYSIYSEELNRAIEEYLLTKEKAASLENGAVNYDRLAETALEKLKVWGLEEAAIRKLSKGMTVIPFYSPVTGMVAEINIKEGDYVQTGTPICRIEDYSQVWVEAEVYPEEVKYAETGKVAEVRVEGVPGVFAGKIDFISPLIDPASRNVKVRVGINNRDQLIKPGMLASVYLNEAGNERLIVRSAAVLSEAGHAMVWLKKEGEDTFYSKMVKTGHSGGGNTEILAGLKNGDLYVWSGAYLLNSEYKLRHGGDMRGHEH